MPEGLLAQENSKKTRGRTIFFMVGLVCDLAEIVSLKIVEAFDPGQKNQRNSDGLHVYLRAS